MEASVLQGSQSIHIRCLPSSWVPIPTVGDCGYIWASKKGKRQAMRDVVKRRARATALGDAGCADKNRRASSSSSSYSSSSSSRTAGSLKQVDPVSGVNRGGPGPM